MKQPLPYGDFKWLEEEFLNELNAHLCREELQEWIDLLTADGQDAFVECDLVVPEELHNRFNSYPPAPEKAKVRVRISLHLWRR